MWHALEIPRSKTKTNGNSTWLFLEFPWNFHFFFSLPLEFPQFFLIPLENLCPEPQQWVFFCNSPISVSSVNLPCLDFSGIPHSNDKRKYFSLHIHRIHMSCVNLIYNIKIIWSPWDDNSIYLVNWCRMGHTRFYCSTNKLIVMYYILHIITVSTFILSNGHSLKILQGSIQFPFSFVYFVWSPFS